MAIGARSFAWGVEEERMEFGEKGAYVSAGDWEQGAQGHALGGAGGRRHPTMTDARSSGASDATEEKVND